LIELCQNIAKSVFRHKPSIRTVAMETMQLVLSQFKKKLFNLMNRELSKVSLCAK